MPSQPDYERAYSLSPKLKPVDPAILLRKQNEALAARIAKAEGKTPEQVLKELEQQQLPADQQPHKVPVTPETVTVVPVAPQDAKFFANKEGDKFYPIEKRTKVPFVNMKEEKAVYFKTEEEALAANYVKA